MAFRAIRSPVLEEVMRDLPPGKEGGQVQAVTV